MSPVQTRDCTQVVIVDALNDRSRSQYQLCGRTGSEFDVDSQPGLLKSYLIVSVVISVRNRMLLNSSSSPLVIIGALAARSVHLR